MSERPATRFALPQETDNEVRHFICPNGLLRASHSRRPEAFANRIAPCGRASFWLRLLVSLKLGRPCQQAAGRLSFETGHMIYELLGGSAGEAGVGDLPLVGFFHELLVRDVQLSPFGQLADDPVEFHLAG